MKKSFYWWLIVLAFSFGCTSPSTDNQEQEIILPEKLIDRIQLADLNGDEIDLKQYIGKTVFLNFWATWCKPCLAEMPDIDKANEILPDSSFVFLAASDEDMDRINKFVLKTDFSFQFVRSKVSIFDLEIKALPTTMIINPDGEIIYNEVGARDWASQSQIEYLQKIDTK